MIDPFTILSTRVEADGSTGVLYSVTNTVLISDSERLTKKLEGYYNSPAGEDPKLGLLAHLQQGGWVE